MAFLLVLSASGSRTRLVRREYDYEYHFIEYEYDGPPKSAASKYVSEGRFSDRF